MSIVRVFLSLRYLHNMRKDISLSITLHERRMHKYAQSVVDINIYVAKSGYARLNLLKSAIYCDIIIKYEFN